MNVRLVYRHSPPTKWIESWVDSGSHVCMFHADFCRGLGINFNDGLECPLGGVIGGATVPLYFHRVKILIGSEQAADKLSVAGLLGRRGFFDNFIVKIDSSAHLPYFELEKIHRA